MYIRKSMFCTAVLHSKECHHGKCTAIQFPRLNEPAPAFCARTTHGERKFEDYRGKWLILFTSRGFHAGVYDRVHGFRQSGTDLQFDGLRTSVCRSTACSRTSAWTRNIKEKFNVDIPFPIIEI